MPRSWSQRRGRWSFERCRGGRAGRSSSRHPCVIARGAGWEGGVGGRVWEGGPRRQGWGGGGGARAARAPAQRSVHITPPTHAHTHHPRARAPDVAGAHAVAPLGGPHLADQVVHAVCAGRVPRVGAKGWAERVGAGEAEGGVGRAVEWVEGVCREVGGWVWEWVGGWVGGWVGWFGSGLKVSAGRWVGGWVGGWVWEWVGKVMGAG